MWKFGLKLTALGACFFYAASAQATVYIAERSVAGGTISFSLTTDDTLGVLGSNNITNYAITITSGLDVSVYNPGNASMFVFGTALTATATDLNFDFNGAANSFLVFNRGPGLGDHYCFETSGCSGVFNSAESFRFGQSGQFQGEQREGIQAIASIAAVQPGVPEPTTWAMMLLGFAGVGYSMRRRRKLVALAQFA